MRLIELSLQHVRGVSQRTVTFTQNPGELTGVIIVEGPNEAGKTTIRDAFIALLTFKASSKHSDVKLLQTAGVDEAPHVSATFMLGQRQFVYKKKFTKRPTTELAVTGHDPVQLTGDEAHDYVTAALDQQLDRGLWQALWLTQRELASQPVIDDARGLTRVLDAGSNTGAVGIIEHAVVDAARRHYATFFTEKTGQVRAEQKQLDAEYETALAELQHLDAELAAMQHDSDERDRLDAELPRLFQARQKAEQDAKDAHDAVKKVAELRNNLRVAHAEHAAAVASRDTLAARNEHTEQLVAAHAKRTERIGVLAEEHAQYDHVLAGLKAELAAAEQARIDAQTARDNLRRMRQQCADKRALRHAVDARDAIVTRYERLQQYTREQAEIAQALSHNTLTTDVLHQLDQTQHAVDVARIQQQQSAPEITIKAHQDVQLTVDNDVTVLPAHDTWQTSLTASTQITIGELATVAITLPASAHANTLTDAQRALHDALEPFGVTTIEEARAKRDAHDTLNQRLARLETDYATLLGDNTRHDIEQAYGLIDANLDTTGLEDAATLDTALVTASNAEQAAERSYDLADTAERQLRGMYDTKAAQAMTTRVTLANEQAEHDRLERELAQTTTAEHTDLAGLLAGAQQIVDASQQQYDTLTSQLHAAGGDDSDALAANADAVLFDLVAAEQANERRRDQLDTSIRLRGGDGLFERREEHAARCSQLADHRDTQQRRAAVAKRLFDTLETHRQQAHSRYIAPLNDEILRFGRLLYGPTFDVELDDQLTIARRHIAGTWLDLEQLSAGAQEQLALISRLACARLLGAEGGVVFFDDALGHTDQARLERLGAVIRLAAENTQLVVLTCDGERFRHVGGATRIVL